MRIIEIPSLPPVGIEAGKLAPWIVWSIWTARNRLLFNNKLCSEEEVVNKAVIAAREWLNAQVKEEQKPSPPPPRRRCQVLPPRRCQVLPPAQYVSMVNTDAAWNGSTRTAGLGWTTRNSEGDHQFKESARLVNSPLTAEALAMRSAVKNCMELGVQHVIFKSDSTQLINALNSLSEPPEIYGIFADIRIYCNAFVSFSFAWIPRSENSEADMLAKQALCLVTCGSAT